MPGWCFGTCLSFFRDIGNDNGNRLIFLRGLETTKQMLFVVSIMNFLGEYQMPVIAGEDFAKTARIDEAFTSSQRGDLVWSGVLWCTNQWVDLRENLNRKP